MKHLTGSKDEPPLDAETLLQSLKENHATTLITLVRTHPTEIDDSVSERMGMEEARLKDVEKTCQAVSLVGDPELDDAVKAQWNALSDHRSCLLKAEQHWKSMLSHQLVP